MPIEAKFSDDTPAEPDDDPFVARAAELRRRHREGESIDEMKASRPDLAATVAAECADQPRNARGIGPALDADHRRRFDAFKRSRRAARGTSPILRGPAPRIVGCHSRERRAAPARSRGSRRASVARSSSSDSDGSGSSDSDDGDPERLGPPSPLSPSTEALA